jgi:hypothetical protein
MVRKIMLSSHVKRLLSGVSDHGIRHLTEVETDLVQTALLLTEAIEKLGASFLEIHALASAQQETMNLLLAGGTPSEEQIAGIKSMQVEMDRQISTVITSLQFQDMTSQLLDRSQKRVTGLREFLATLGTHGAGLHMGSDNDEMVELLKRISVALAIQSMELKSVLRKAVHQQHLEAGDVDLF